MEVAAFIGSEEWVDLYRVFDSQLVTGHPIGEAGRRARGVLVGGRRPGGDQSMVRYDEAVGASAGAGPARDWLLAYNRNDTQATRALRDWLDDGASACPAIESACGTGHEGTNSRGATEARPDPAAPPSWAGVRFSSS